jgi:AcrR family transcriptional regulator
MSAVRKRRLEADILSAAAQVFAKKGFAQTRVEDVLVASGVARRTFYQYFASKEDVLEVIYAQATGELLAAMQDAGGTHLNALDAVRAGLDAYLDYHASNPRLLRELVQQAIRSDSPLHAHRARLRKDLIRLIDLAVLRSTGEVYDRLLYAGLLSAVEGVSLELLARNPSRRDVARAKSVLELLIERTLRP